MISTRRLLAFLALRPIANSAYQFPRNLYKSIGFSSFCKTFMTDSSSSSGSPVLDREVFNSEFELIALKIPAKQCTNFLKTFKNYLWERPRMKKILNIDGEDDNRLLLLSKDKIKSDIDIPIDLKDFITSYNGIITSHNMKLGYENLTVDEVLKYYFPERDDTPGAFEQVGHLAHMNLRPEYLSYKHIIGQVIIDKLPHIKTVVNKLGNIDTKYRTFPMELLAGDDNYNVSLRESGAKFTFDFRSVYWNSRLQMEHFRLIKIIRDSAVSTSSSKKTIVADLMCGIGPFAIPLAMGGLVVHANDLNPASYEYLLKNSQQNKCTSKLIPYNLDARAFVLDLVENDIGFDHAPMNLPQTATDFLDIFIGLKTRYKDSTNYRVPRIHVYAFATADDVIDDVRQRCAKIMRIKEEELPSSAVKGHIVRDVAPKKLMVCLSFDLPDIVADSEPLSLDELQIVSSNRGKHLRDDGDDVVSSNKK